MSNPVEVLRHLLPTGVAVAGAPVGTPAPLWPGEETAVANARPPRRAEFAAGRAAARAALALLGHPPAALPRDPRGLPLWPAGLTGSITHAGAHALAAVAPLAAFRALGIDMEEAGADLPLADIATPDEITRLGRADPIRLFSAKEAAYKAQFPQSGLMLGFHDLDVTLTETGFTARFTTDAAPFTKGATLTGRQGQAGRFILSAVCIAP